MPCMIRSSLGDCSFSLTFAGALRTMRECSGEVTINTIFGRFLAVRKVAE